jgi:hypothetical protein
MGLVVHDRALWSRGRKPSSSELTLAFTHTLVFSTIPGTAAKICRTWPLLFLLTANMDYSFYNYLVKLDMGISWRAYTRCL